MKIKSKYSQNMKKNKLKKLNQCHEREDKYRKNRKSNNKCQNKLKHRKVFQNQHKL